ncbi:MAG: J domain-containing protein, partial [Treponema sp.]|nr:J domain-containing protein [Treponema sp.]
TYLVEADPHFTGESKAGITAFCGLAFISIIPDQAQEMDFAMDHIVQSALQLFHCPLQDGAALEQVCRLAKEHKKNINVDLLAESLKARTKNYIAPEQIVAVLRELVNLYGNNDFDKLNSIAQILCPGIKPGGHHSPWGILGLKPDSSIQQIKKAFRKLALQFHPDRLSALSEERKRAAQERFIQIRRAYRQALAEKQEQKRDHCS